MGSALDRAIALVTDGEEVDWDSLHQVAITDAEREALRQLRYLAGEFTESRVSPPETPPVAGAGLGAPDLWGHLKLLDELGRGASGVVYRAWDRKLNREVALKLLHEGSGDTTFEEAQRLARISHPSIVTIYGVDQCDGRTGLWMELLRGETLDAMLRSRGPFSAREAAGVVRDLCTAVAAVHAAGLVHRDIKAQNVIREPGGRLVLMDLGASDALADDTRVRSLAGTPLYMAPELLDGERATVASDIYALGVLLYRLVSNAYPIEGQTVGDLRRAHAAKRLRPLREVRPDLPAAYIAVVDRCLAADAADRYPAVPELERALASWELGVSTPRIPSPLLLMAGLILSALLGAGGTWAVMWYRAGTPPERNQGLSPDQYALFASYEDLAFERLESDPAAAASSIRSAMEVMRPALPGLRAKFVLLFLRVAEAERRAGNLSAARAALMDAHAHAVSVLDDTDPIRILIAAEEARIATAANNHVERERAWTAVERLRALTFRRAFAASGGSGTPLRNDSSAFLTIAAHRSHAPADLGWQSHLRFPATGSPLGSGPSSGWRLEAHESMAYQYQRISPGLTRRAIDRGFSVLARIEPEQGLANVAFDTAPSGRRFDLFFRRTEAGELELRAAAGIVPRTGQALTVPLPKQDEAPLVELRYDGQASSAAIYVDGERVIDDYRGHTQFQDAQSGAVSWGVTRTDAADPARASARFSLVWLQIQ